MTLGMSISFRPLDLASCNLAFPSLFNIINKYNASILLRPCDLNKMPVKIILMVTL